MKIQIEEQIHGGTTAKEELNRIIERALMSTNLETLKDLFSTRKYQEWEIGFGSDHCWVKQKDINGNLYENRTLFITN